MPAGKAMYRHEYKYPISQGELCLLKSRIVGLMKTDAHVNEEGMYHISSLYFDDYEDTCLRENINGTDPREKFRIRMYNHDVRHLKLECKRKQNGKTLKTACAVTVEQVEQILKGQPLSGLTEDMPLLLKFEGLRRTKLLVPKVIVEYDRLPYVCKTGNVRITFDMNLSSSPEVQCYLTGAKRKRPVMPNGMLLLEVKYDEFLPDYIYRAVNIENLTQMAYSKYYLCRRYCI